MNDNTIFSTDDGEKVWEVPSYDSQIKCPNHLIENNREVCMSDGQFVNKTHCIEIGEAYFTKCDRYLIAD